MTISDNTLNVNVWAAIRSVIVAAAPQVTNSNTSGTKTATISPAYNDKRTTVPQVVIYSPTYSENAYKFGAYQGKKIINVLVECYYSTSLGVNELSDAVEHAIRTNPIDGIELIGVSTDVAFVNPNEQDYHLKGITFTFDRE